MESMIIISIYVALSLILLTYVVYRFKTDKPEGNKRHPLYPLVSNPTDPTFPINKTSITFYIFMFAGILGVLLQLINESSDIAIPNVALVALQACLPISLFLFIILKAKAHEK